jgi:hypothetical protein
VGHIKRTLRRIKGATRLASILILLGIVIVPIRHTETFNSPSKHTPTKQELKDYARAKYQRDEIQFECFDALITMESHWNSKAKHPHSKAYGIGQALPASKMASAGSDYLTNPYTQIDWALHYLKKRYNNSGCRALRFHLNHNYW